MGGQEPHSALGMAEGAVRGFCSTYYDEAFVRMTVSFSEPAFLSGELELPTLCCPVTSRSEPERSQLVSRHRLG